MTKKNIITSLIFFIIILVGLQQHCYAQIITPLKNTNNSSIDNGKRIYQQGILPNGNSLSAVGAAGIELSGSIVSCIRCHRRSGFGSVEGNIRISPILGDILYDKPNKNNPKNNKIIQQRRSKALGARPTYTDSSLKKTIIEGINPNNRVLNSLMPRYKLTDNEVTALIDYLKSLSINTDPGISKSEIHVATIITDGVANNTGNLMLKIMTSYFNDTNAKTR